MNDELPEGWATTALGDIAEVNPRHQRDLDDDLMVSFVPMPVVSETDWRLVPDQERPLSEVRTGYTQFAEGDVLFAKITPCMENGKAAVATHLRNGLGCGTTELHVLRPHPGVNSTYLYHFIHQESFRREAANNFTGTAGQLRVPVDFMRTAAFPLPPTAEQRRIVAQIEALLGKVISSRERLLTVPALLKRFRKAVLIAACNGQLTADWRAAEGNNEDARVLLEQMEIERQKAWTARNGHRKYAAPESVETEELPDIPANWVWTNFDHCTWEITVGHVGPMKDRYVPSGGVPFLRSQNVRPLRFDTNGIVRIPAEFHADLSKSRLVGGEILVVRSGANTGDCCVYPRDAGEANCADLVVSRPLSGLLAEFGAIYVASPIGQALLTLRETGIAQPHFNIGAMRVKAFPLPPFLEQNEIVERVQKLLLLADRLEARYRKARALVERLTQSVLAKAFGGELVPTEAELARREGRSYETAEELLARIKAQNENTTNARPRERKKTVRT